MDREFRRLANLRTLRSVAKNMELELLKEVFDKLAIVIAEEEERRAELAKVEEEKENQLLELANKIKNLGVDAEELLAAMNSSNTKKKRKPKAPKYRYYDYDGTEKTWTGQGRTPLVIQTALDNGQTLESFLIEK